jgi:hypothetical protein
VLDKFVIIIPLQIPFHQLLQHTRDLILQISVNRFLTESKTRFIAKRNITVFRQYIFIKKIKNNMDKKLIHLTSKRNKPMIMFDGYVYHSEKSNKPNEQHWRCENRQCGGVLITNED